MGYNRLNNGQNRQTNTYSKDLAGTVAAFLDETCEDLRFDYSIEEEERRTGIYLGKSIKENQIPYNMQMDIDRLCLVRALERFLDSGDSDDAYDVYFCFIEMFIGKYGHIRGIVELLSEFENNGSALLMKHRDHYSHSVYVFALGMAIYETNEKYRSSYSDFYGISDPKEAAHHFLRHWGMAALFHDVGYPFELPFEQVASYFEIDKKARKTAPFIKYAALERSITISEQMKRKIAKAFSDKDAVFSTTDELLAYDIANKLSAEYYFTRDQLLTVLKEKTTNPDKFNYSMDHGYFSAMIVFKKIYEGLDLDITRADVDVLTAIILHNSLYKFNITCIKNEKINKPFKMELHPLAYLLMFCDELQCWDRTGYGRNTKMELHPMDCNLSFGNNSIEAKYIYDSDQKYKANQFIKSYRKWKKEKPVEQPGDRLFQNRMELWNEDKPRIKAWSDMYSEEGEESPFIKDIKSIVDTKDLGLTVDYTWSKHVIGKKKNYLSESNFIHLYYFALALNGRWMLSSEWQKAKINDMERDFLMSKIDDFYEAFDKLSLEYKLSNINQAKGFDEYLHAIDCFYTDRTVDFEMLDAFTEEQTLKIGPLEHERWLNEHIDMGWKHKEKELIENRELERCHPDMIPDDMLEHGKLTHEAAEKHYHMLSKEEQDKDIEPMNAMIKLMSIFDGIRIYRLN